MKFAPGPPGNAAVDLNLALDAADLEGDRAAHAWLQALIFDYLGEKLSGMSAHALVAHLASLKEWRQEEDCAVNKSVENPAVAFTALEFDTGLRILALGFCYRYPGSEDDWWQSVIRPRLRHFL